jgi:ParB-like nuclease domain
VSTFNWRDHLKVHPAADAFPEMSKFDPKGFEALADDIAANGMRQPIVLRPDKGGLELLDGRTRLDALESKGVCIEFKHTRKNFPGISITADGRPVPTNIKSGLSDEQIRLLILSLNLHRRHLTAEMKDSIIAALLKENPETSDRAIAKRANEAGADTNHKRVGKVRREQEGRGTISHVEKRTDSAGRKQPAKKKIEPEPKTPPTPVLAPAEPKTPESATVPVIAHLVKPTQKLRKATQQLAADIAASGDDAQAILVEGIERIESQITSLIEALQKRAAPPAMMTELADALSLITRKAVNAIAEPTKRNGGSKL